MTHIPIIPSPPDSRDFNYQASDQPIRNVVDLRVWASPVDDQLQLGSCVANATVNAFELLTLRDFPDRFTDLSRLFVYYNTRNIENMLLEDSGVIHIRNTLKTVNHLGVCSEALWPYDQQKLTTKPTDECYVDAQSRLISTYTALSNVDQICDSINNNIPVVIGMYVYSEFHRVDSTNPVVPLPTSISHPAGGHSVCVVGYDLDTKLLLIKNSWGTTWGDQGYGYLTFEYMNRYVFERWNFSIRLDQR